MSNRYGITLDSEWIEWAAKEKASETVAAALLLICETRPVHEVVAKLTPGEFERVVDIVRRSPDHFPSGTLAALKSRSPIPAHRQQSASVSTDRETRQRPVSIASPDPALRAQRPLNSEAKPANNQASRVDHVIEVGGPGTLPQSMAAVAIGGHIALSGVLTGRAGEIATDSIDPRLTCADAYLSLTRFERSGVELGGKAAFAVTPRRRSSAACSARSSFLSPGT